LAVTQCCATSPREKPESEMPTKVWYQTINTRPASEPWHGNRATLSNPDSKVLATQHHAAAERCCKRKCNVSKPTCPYHPPTILRPITSWAIPLQSMSTAAHNTSTPTQVLQITAQNCWYATPKYISPRRKTGHRKN
jgi:hypothetical protein